MRTRLLAALVCFAGMAAAHPLEPQWEPLNDPQAGDTAVFYSPSTARVATEKEVLVREVDVKLVDPDGNVVEQTWKVIAKACDTNTTVDVAVFEHRYENLPDQPVLDQQGNSLHADGSGGLWSSSLERTCLTGPRTPTPILC